MLACKVAQCEEMIWTFSSLEKLFELHSFWWKEGAITWIWIFIMDYNSSKVLELQRLLSVCHVDTNAKHWGRVVVVVLYLLVAFYYSRSHQAKVKALCCPLLLSIFYYVLKNYENHISNVYLLCSYLNGKLISYVLCLLFHPFFFWPEEENENEMSVERFVSVSKWLCGFINSSICGFCGSI